MYFLFVRLLLIKTVLFAFDGRVTFFQQLKKVTKKSRPYSIALRVPEFTGIANEPALMRHPGAQG